jgi:hypothetical protein
MYLVRSAWIFPEAPAYPDVRLCGNLTFLLDDQTGVTFDRVLQRDLLSLAHFQADEQQRTYDGK